MELLTVQEVADLLKVSPITVRRHIAAGRLPAVRAGRRVRVPRESLETFLTPAHPNESIARGRRPLFPPPTQEELARRRDAVDAVLTLREKMPSIAPLTTVDLVCMAREEEGPSYDRGDPKR
jgi:excisionase family DNA binding protein